MEKLAYTVEETAKALSVSRDLIYDAMREGKLSYVQVTSRKRLITADAIRQFLAGKVAA